jgi:hypothetical protein
LSLSLSKAFSASRVNNNNSSLFVLDSIMTSDAMKAANSIGIASVAGLVSDQFGCLP